ncbi:MAG: BofC C-terminal domain-containing protein [Oscillospiraceae bacterium]|nr:BofC C-terminal domain-containing protein [Oscillospiraceae bacterium]
MKKLNTVILVCAVAITALLVVTLSITSEVRETKKTPSSTFVYSSANAASSQESNTLSTTSPASSSASEQQAIYLVKTYKGKIGIFHVGETVPFRILNVLIQNLPKADQQLLESGISVQTSEELQQIIEDYVS